MRSPILFAALALSGCSLALKYEECSVDADCQGRMIAGGAAMYCTRDKLCVGGLPEERLCTGGDVSSPFEQYTPASLDPKDRANTVVAGLFRLTGASGDKDTEMARAAVLAMDEIAQSNQRRTVMVFCDTRGDKVQAERSLLKAVREYHIVGAVGPTTSSEMLYVAGTNGVAVPNDLALISASATNPQIRDLADNRLVWRTAANDELQATKLAEIIPLMIGSPARATTVNTAYVDSAYGKGLNNAFVAAWSTRSGRTPGATVAFAEGSDLDVMLAKLGAGSPDYAMIVSDADAAAIAQKLYKTSPPGLNATQFLLTDGAKGASLLMEVNPVVATRIRGTAPATPSGQVFNVFKLAYANKFQTDPGATSFVANTYDATYALALGVAASPAPVSGSSIADVLGRMSAGTALNIGPNNFTAAATTLAGAGSVDLAGASGPLTWDPNTGDLLEAPLEVWGIKSGAFCTFDATLTTCQ